MNDVEKLIGEILGYNVFSDDHGLTEMVRLEAFETLKAVALELEKQRDFWIKEAVTINSPQKAIDRDNAALAEIVKGKM